MRYDKDFKLQVLQLSDEIDVKAAAEQLGLKYYTLANRRKIRKEQGENAFIGSDSRQVLVYEKIVVLKNLKLSFTKINCRAKNVRLFSSLFSIDISYYIKKAAAPRLCRSIFNGWSAFSLHEWILGLKS